MSSSEDEVTRLPPGTNSDDEPNTRSTVGRTRGVIARKKAITVVNDDSSSEEEETALPTANRSDDSDDSDGSSQVSSTNQDNISEWLQIDYDTLTEDEFVLLLQSSSYAERCVMKQRHDEQLASVVETQVPHENFTDYIGTGYKYTDMLDRIYGVLRKHNPELGDNTVKQIKLPAPKTEKSGTKTTAFTNFKDMCKAMNRDMDHVKDFIEKELTTSSSIDANLCLIVKIRNVRTSQIESVFQKYIEKYCQCDNCEGIDTILERNTVNRLWNLKCQSCKAGRTVQAATSATYKAQIGRRQKF